MAIDLEKVGPRPLATAKVLLLRDPFAILTPNRTKPPLNFKERNCHDPEAGLALSWQQDGDGGGGFGVKPIYCGSTYETRCRRWQNLDRRSGLERRPDSLIDLLLPRFRQRWDAGVAMHIGLAPYMSGPAGRTIRRNYARLEHSTGASGLYLPLPIRKASDAPVLHADRNKPRHAHLTECHYKDEAGQPTDETFFRTTAPDVPLALVIADRRHLSNIEWITPTWETFEALLRRYLAALPTTQRRPFGDWEFLLAWRTDSRTSLTLDLNGMPEDKLFERAARIGQEDGYLDRKPRRKRVSTPSGELIVLVPLSKRKRQFLTPFEAKLFAKQEIPLGRNGATLFTQLLRPAYEQLRAEAGKPVRKRKPKPPKPKPQGFN